MSSFKLSAPVYDTRFLSTIWKLKITQVASAWRYEGYFNNKILYNYIHWLNSALNDRYTDFICKIGGILNFYSDTASIFISP